MHAEALHVNKVCCLFLSQDITAPQHVCNRRRNAPAAAYRLKTIARSNSYERARNQHFTNTCPLKEIGLLSAKLICEVSSTLSSTVNSVQRPDC